MLERSRLLRIIGIILGLAPIGTAMAQDADSFNVAGSLFDGQGTLQLTAPRLGTGNAPYGGLGFVLAKDPLLVEYPDGTLESVVATQFSARIVAGHTFNKIFRLDVEVPVYPALTVHGEYDYALGQIRVGGLLPVHAIESDRFALGFEPTLILPPSSPDVYLGNGGVGGLDLVTAMGGAFGPLEWTGNAGVALTPAAELGSQHVGSGILYGGGLHSDVMDKLAVGAELTGRIGVARDFAPWDQSPLEWHLYAAQGLPGSLMLSAGVGSGIIAGIGAPEYRLFLGVSYRAPGEDVNDLDDDGIINADDRCPRDPEDKDGFEDVEGCPDVDNDQDGILDVNDRCPEAVEDLDKFEDDDGCPEADNDKDGILDGEDACPVDPGPILTQGCPDRDGDGLADSVDECPDLPGPVASGGCPDRDGDRVPDLRDACPDEAADARIDPKHSDGCPSRVFRSAEKIEILDVIYFDTGKATIKPVSYPLLQEIAGVLKNNPDIQRIEVQGHTDSLSDDDRNLQLSQARAQAVTDFLVRKGSVDPSRLVPKGYGETRPIDTNLTDEGKARNRRVEFVILGQ